jgi:hypothetical protein
VRCPIDRPYDIDFHEVLHQVGGFDNV